MGLKECTAICVDTAHHALAAKAAETCASLCDFADIFILSDKETSFPTKIIPKLDGISGYNRFILESLINHVETEHVLIFQWDGFVLHPDCWDDAFLTYDYIGSPWPKPFQDNVLVGNGGFSLRSRRLLEKIGTLEKSHLKNEDRVICEDLMPQLAPDGLCIAPEDLASCFAYETAQPCRRTFGFHGDFNFAGALSEQHLFEIISLSPEALWQTWRPFGWIADAVRKGDRNVAARLYELCRSVRPIETALWTEQCGEALLGAETCQRLNPLDPNRGHSRADKTAVVVAGMHRSGTSSLTGALFDLGATAPKTPMPANPQDPLGFNESMAVMRFNDDLLAARGSRWNDVKQVDGHWGTREEAASWHERATDLVRSEFGDSDLIAIKDPRISRIFSFWESVLRADGREVVVIVMVRSPYEAASSLKARNGIDITDGLRLWLHHNLEIEFATRACRRCFVDWDSLLAKPRPVLAEIARTLGLRWPGGGGLSDSKRTFGIRLYGKRQTLDQVPSGVKPELSVMADNTFSALLDLAGTTACDDALRQLDATRQAFRAEVEANSAPMIARSAAERDAS